jgi:hypothetical protein
MGRILDLLIVAGTALLAVRLFTTGILHRRYRIFFYYLIFETLRATVLAYLGQGSNAYQKAWVLTEPVEWLFLAMVVLEIYALVLQDYRGLSTASRWAVIAAVAIALLASALSLIAPSQSSQSHLMRYYYVAERAVYFSLVVFLISILGFLMQYPITLSRNIVVHSMVFSVYFLGNSFIYLLLSTRGYGSLPVVTYALDAVTLAALGAWLALLSPAGELRKLRIRHYTQPGREEELVNQLGRLNAALLRATNK